jgi:hypothetical protein
MAEGAKWTPGKIFLLVVGILGGLALLCCGGVWILFGDKILAGIAFGKDSTAFIERLEKDLGTGATFGIEQNDKAEMVLTVAVKGDLTPERVTEVQDTAWRALSDCFGKNGFFPVKEVGIGRTGASTKRGRGVVLDWSRNCVTVEELVKRTGVPAPPLVKFLPEEFAGNGTGVRVQVKGGGGEEEPGGDGK